MALQVVIALTGNYAFFNALTILLCLLCFDDLDWQRLRRRPLRAPEPARHPPAWSLRAFAAVVYTVTILGVVRTLGLMPPTLFNPLLEAVAPFESLNNYGLFAVMTRPRTELIFEGSNDERTWREYEFPYKPGDVTRAPAFVAPYQPRLDWQLWFATLDAPEASPWLNALCAHLLGGTPDVLALIKKNPFPDAPPVYIRVQRYTYNFTTPAERRQTGQWWKRSKPELYLGPAKLNSQ